MILSLNEINDRAIKFANDWADVTSERAEAQTFWDDFFRVFGVERKKVGSFEKYVKKLDEKSGFIDLFWPGMLVVEHKSAGANLDKAFGQALDYFPGLEDYELPKYVIVSDFQRIRLFDLEEGTEVEFQLVELHSNTHLFNFISGYKQKTFKDEDPVNVQAAELMGRLHDELLKYGYKGHKLEVFLVRILFCLFADDTNIFPKSHFSFYLHERTLKDGSNLGERLSTIFQIMNSPDKKRMKNIDVDLGLFPYVDGSLFEEQLEVPSFNTEMRSILLSCCYFDWSRISPAIFGSMFQSVMDKEVRKNLGAHYTSEKNILKVISGLFLEDLHKEFNEVKNDLRKLEKFHEKLAGLKFLDPACGCGNFLIIAYREIRLLEIDILKQYGVLKKHKQLGLGTGIISRIDVDSMYGIEIEEFPVRVAEVALWLVDHQMNIRLSEEFALLYTRLPLKKSPNIRHANAHRFDWGEFISKSELNYILGNPPFVAKKNRTEEQNVDMGTTFKGFRKYGQLDYVAAWYIRAANYISGTDIKVAFVSTGSITQGEQVGILWSYLLDIGIDIFFAHRMFKWSNEARGVAQVFVVIIGFAAHSVKNRTIFDYEKPTSDPVAVSAKTINPYIIDFADVIISNRSKPICEVPALSFGSMPNDGGNLLLTNEEKDYLLSKEPGSEDYIKPLISAKEYLYGIPRWCLWLEDISPSKINKYKGIKDRVKEVKEYRLNSKRKATRELAKYPYLFGEIRQPNDDYIAIPLTTSENRKYIPIAIIDKEIIVNNTFSTSEPASYFHFGVLTSIMHMTWVKYVCGRLEGRFRYSNKLVYNNFPWPKKPTDKQISKVEKAVERVLLVRDEHTDSTLAELYDPLLMPKMLVKAHNALDRAVDLCYSRKNFDTDLKKLEFLFGLYSEYTAPVIPVEKKRKRSRK